MTQTNFLLSQAVISNGTATGNAWINAGNLLLAGSSYASTPAVYPLSSDVTIGNFAFNLPANAIPTGIEIEFTGFVDSVTSPATTLDLYAYDNTNDNNFLYQLTPAFSGFTTSATTFNFGGTNFLFGVPWTAEQINNLKFRLVANGEVNVNNFKVRITYAEPATVTNPVINVCNNYIQAQPFFLAKPLNKGEYSVYLESFNDSEGLPITNLRVNGHLDATLSQGEKGREENVRITNITYLGSGLIKLDISRGWGFDSDDINPSTSRERTHGLNAELVLGNNVPFYSQFLRVCDIGTKVSPPIAVLDEGTLLTTSTKSFNFVGAGVTASVVGNDTTVVIPGAGTYIINPSITNIYQFTTGNVQQPNISTNVTSAGSDRMLVVAISTEQTKTVSSITYNGIALTQAGSETRVSGSLRSEIWYIVNPPLGTYGLLVTMSAPAYISGVAYSLTNTDQGSQPDVFGGNNSLGTAVSETITTATDNALIIDSLSTGFLPITHTAGTGQTVGGQNVTATRQISSSYKVVGGAPITTSQDYTLSTNTDWAITVIGIKGLLISGGTSVTGVANVGTGTGNVFKNITGSTVNLRTIKAGTNTTVTTVGDEIIIDSTGGSGGTGTATKDTITQVGHGFTIGEPTVVRKDSTGDYVKSLAVKTSASDLSAEVIGIAIATTVDDFDLYFNGRVPTPGYFGSLQDGTPLYLSDLTLGELTDTEPTGATKVSKPVGYVDNAGTDIVMHNMRGIVTDSSGGSGIGNLVYSEILDLATIAGGSIGGSATYTIPHTLGYIPKYIKITFTGEGLGTTETSGFAYIDSFGTILSQSCMSRLTDIGGGPFFNISSTSSFDFWNNGQLNDGVLLNFTNTTFQIQYNNPFSFTSFTGCLIEYYY